MKSIVMMIEGGRALEMVSEHISEVLRVQSEVSALAKELGVEMVTRDRRTGVLAGAKFNGDIHPDFRKPKRGNDISYPKKGTEWAQRLADQVGYRDPAEWISTEFGIPVSIRYEGNGGAGCCMIGNPLNECGFLYLSKDGPYAMWAPDVLGAVARKEADGYVVDEPARSFRFNIEGCRLIENEEWEILVLQHKLAKKEKKGAAV